MSRKTPATGVINVEVHAPPTSRTHAPVTRPGIPPPVDFWSSLGMPARHSPGTGRTAPGADPDAIGSVAQRVSVSDTANQADAPAVAERPLSDYWINTVAALPVPDSHGLSRFKGRLYAKVANGGTVQVGADPDTGLYRAKLASERSPSGPVVLHDPQSRIWHPPDHFAPSTYPLSTRRLRDFRTDLDFAGVAPGSDGLHRFNDKLYVSIDNHAYQVLHDLDASTPLTTVMRVIRPEDPVAAHERNVYIAMRPGKSEPIVLDTQRNWTGTEVGGVSGMRRRESSPGEFRMVDLLDQLATLETEVVTAVATSARLRAEWETLRGTEGERNALILRELQHQRELALSKKRIEFYKDNKALIVASDGRDQYKAKMLHLHERRILAYEQILEASVLRQALDGSIVGMPTAKLPAFATFLKKQLTIMEKLQQLQDELVKRWRVSRSEMDGLSFSEADIHQTVAMWIYVKSRLMGADEPGRAALEPPHLAVLFRQTTVAYGAIDSIPHGARSAVLSDVLEQCVAIRAAYERLILPADPKHSVARNEIIAHIKTFEATLEQRLTRVYQEQVQNSALPAHQQPIDFDFIPPQDRSGPAPQSWRIFRARQHGVYKIRVGQTRRTAHGVELIDVINPNEPGQHLQTFERQDGEWRPLNSTQAKSLPKLITEASRHLEESGQVLKKALQSERDKDNANNIVETLGRHARALDDTALELEHAPGPSANADRVALIESLRQDSQRLRTEGEAIRVRLYKDKAYLSADRVAYLINTGHISAVKTQTRLKRGKGQDRTFLDFYTLMDTHTREPLWHAHFHYAKKDTPDIDFNDRGAHLKTLEQSGRGLSSQRKDEQMGLPHVAIWRETIDKRTAQRIFDLAASTTDTVQ